MQVKYLAAPFLLAVCLLNGGCSDSSDNRPASFNPDQASLGQTTVYLPSAAQPAHTPGTPGVVASGSVAQQFGDSNVDLNRAIYTRYYLEDQDQQPDAILVVVPGFEGGASGFAKLASNLMHRAREESGLIFEIWAMDRRSHQLEDRAGLAIAQRESDAQISLDFLFGEELELELGPELSSELGRRVVFHNTSDSVAFMAQWTTLTHSQDLDAIIDAAHEAVNGGNVFLGGHSAGTGYVARYAATDFNFEGGNPEPGYAKVRGLVMFDGGGGSLGDAPSEQELDAIEARFDGGLFGAVSSQQPRCSDGVTTCTVATAATDCADLPNTTCVEPTSAYSVLPLLTSEIFAASEAVALDAELNGEGVQSILQQDQNGQEGNNAIEQVDELSGLKLLLGSEPASSLRLLGSFVDDDGVAAGILSFLSISLGATGPAVDGVRTWLTIQDELPAEATPDNGPKPTDINTADIWGVEVEVSDLAAEIVPMFYLGDTNYTDWYYPSSGLSVTSGLGLDTTALSAPPPKGRGRSDIDNRTQAQNVNLPVISFGGSNGLLPVSGRMVSYADSLARCAAPSCDGTERVLDRSQPSTAFPSFGDVGGGFEVYISEGYSHVDVLTANDDETNNIIGPLLAFIQRNLQ